MFLIFLIGKSAHYQKIFLPETNYKTEKVAYCNDLFLATTREVFIREEKWRKIYSATPYDEIRDLKCINDTLILLTKKKIFIYVNGFIELNNLPSEGIQLTSYPYGNIIILTKKRVLRLNGQFLKTVFSFTANLPEKIATGRRRSIIFARNYLYFISNGKTKYRIRSKNIKDFCYFFETSQFLLLTRRKNYFKFNEFNIREITLPGDKILCDKKIFTYDKSSLYEREKRIFITDSKNEKIVGIAPYKNYPIIMTNLFLYLPYENNQPSTGISINNFKCPYLPPLKSILDNSSFLNKKLFSISSKWFENAKKRGYIPRISLSFSYGKGNNFTTTAEDTISASAYTGSVVVGPQASSSRNNNSRDYEVSITLTWEPEKLFFSNDELSIAYRIMDIEEEKRFIFNQINENYTKAILLKEKCCEESDLESCIELLRAINLLKFYTKFSPELWKEKN